MARSVTLAPRRAWYGGEKLGGWWHALGDRLICDVCPRGCALGPGERGYCRVRRNVDGRLVLDVYGQVAAAQVGLVETQPLHHFFPGSQVLSLGTVGCNLACKFCGAWQLALSRSMFRRLASTASPREIAVAAQRLGCHSVAFACNEPVPWLEFVIDTARWCRRLGIQTIAVTAGYVSPCARAAFFRELDAVSVGLKGFSDPCYQRLTDAHLQPVLEALEWLRHETDVWLEITTLVIPGVNDARDDIQRMAGWIVERLGPDVPLHFTAFHPDYRMRDRASTPPATLIDARELAMQCGLQYVYTGNVADPDRQSTYCPGCGRLVIARNMYRVVEYGIRQGACRHCGLAIAGRFGAELIRAAANPSVSCWGLDPRSTQRLCDTLGFHTLRGGPPV